MLLGWAIASFLFVGFPGTWHLLETRRNYRQAIVSYYCVNVCYSINNILETKIKGVAAGAGVGGQMVRHCATMSEDRATLGFWVM